MTDPNPILSLSVQVHVAWPFTMHYYFSHGIHLLNVYVDYLLNASHFIEKDNSSVEVKHVRV